jgi:hypothetical protein
LRIFFEKKLFDFLAGLGTTSTPLHAAHYADREIDGISVAYLHTSRRATGVANEEI